jgi:hypothetical protein
MSLDNRSMRNLNTGLCNIVWVGVPQNVRFEDRIRVSRDLLKVVSRCFLLENCPFRDEDTVQ